MDDIQELECQAIREVARLMLAWSARLGALSLVGLMMASQAEQALLELQPGD